MTTIDDIMGKARLARDVLQINLVRLSLRSYVEKHGGVGDDQDVEDWLRADVERVAGLTLGRRDELIALGMRMVTELADDDNDRT
jgi:hypothetical protein